MPPTKNLVIVAVVVGLLFLAVKIYFHRQDSGSSNDSLPPLPMPMGQPRSTNQ